jgi:hypothetical protein
MEILETKDYKLFKSLPGNRVINKGHVTQMTRHMALVGNLTGNFPVVVNENMEIIDGQHRIEALKRLKWPVYYRIEKGLGIETVRQINAAQSNWSYMDYATSYAKLGLKAYQWFLEVAEKYPYGYNVLMVYSGTAARGRRGKDNAESRHTTMFRSGNLKVEEPEKTEEMLGKLAELSEAADHYSRPWAQALYRVFQNSQYDQTRMLNKLKSWEKEIPHFSGVIDYLRLIEDIYNYRAQPEGVVRLF